MAKMGFRKMNEMIGRCDLLEPADPLNDKVKVSQVNSPFVHLPQYTLVWPAGGGGGGGGGAHPLHPPPKSPL